MNYEIVKQNNYVGRVYTKSMFISSTDRNTAIDPSNNYYRVNLMNTFKKVIAIRLKSAIVPNSYYTFSTALANTSFTMTFSASTKTITIADGNYTSTTLATAIENALNTAYSVSSFDVSVSSITGKMTITNSAAAFTLDTSTNMASTGTHWGLGYSMGFTKTIFDASTSIVSNYVVNPTPYTHLMLILNKESGSTQLNQSVEGSFSNQREPRVFFSTIPITANSFEINFINSDCCYLHESRFATPLEKLETLSIFWRFHDGKDVNFNNIEHSLIFELDCIE